MIDAKDGPLAMYRRVDYLPRVRTVFCEGLIPAMWADRKRHRWDCMDQIVVAVLFEILCFPPG